MYIDVCIYIIPVMCSYMYCLPTADDFRITIGVLLPICIVSLLGNVGMCAMMYYRFKT